MQQAGIPERLMSEPAAAQLASCAGPAAQLPDMQQQMCQLHQGHPPFQPEYSCLRAPPLLDLLLPTPFQVESSIGLFACPRDHFES